MEQQEPRRDFVKALHPFCQEVELNDDLMVALRNHSNHEYIEQVLKFGKELDEILKQNNIDEEIQDMMKDIRDMARKAFIFLEFTRERSTCNEVVDILIQSGQRDTAAKLEKFNTSPPFMLLSNEIELPITPATVPRSGGSKYFTMNQKPRGMFIIINNLKGELENESLRFKNIFKQLSFVVLDFYDMTATQMNGKLTELSKDKTLIDGDALIVMTISHGHDEKIEGVDGSDIRTKSIVNIFSGILKNKPKLFYFNCCRIKNLEIPVIATQDPDNDRITIHVDMPGQNWMNDHQNLMVCFACAEGYRAFFNNGFTYFGQALSHCIAQYACDKSVQSIMILTAQRCKIFGCDPVYGWIRPETRYSGMGRELYLNPGLPIDEA